MKQLHKNLSTNKISNKKDNIVVVFGASGSIGQAICKELLNQNYRLIAINRSSIGKNSIQDRIIHYQCDLLDSKQLSDICLIISKTYPKIKGLVFASGINSTRCSGNIEEKMLNIYRINTVAPYLIIDKLSQLLIKNKASIVLLGSVAGYLPVKDIPYGASKAALISVNKSLAWRFGHYGININIVNPGPVFSKMISHWDKVKMKSKIERTALKKIARPQDIANVVSFLLSSRASHITGSTIDVSGGFEIR